MSAIRVTDQTAAATDRWLMPQRNNRLDRLTCTFSTRLSILFSFKMFPEPDYLFASFYVKRLREIWCSPVNREMNETQERIRDSFVDVGSDIMPLNHVLLHAFT